MFKRHPMVIQKEIFFRKLKNTDLVAHCEVSIGKAKWVTATNT